MVVGELQQLVGSPNCPTAPEFAPQQSEVPPVLDILSVELGVAKPPPARPPDLEAGPRPRPARLPGVTAGARDQDREAKL